MSILDTIAKAKTPAQEHPPTAEQQAIIDACLGSDRPLMMVARAGTGKTSTLEMADRRISRKPHLYLVFNKKNQVEAEKKLPSTTTCRTFNGLGHRIWAGYCSSRLSLDTKKKSDIWRQLLSEVPKDQHKTLWEIWDGVSQGVELARALGYVPESQLSKLRHPALCTRSELHSHLDEEPDDLTADLIDVVLAESIKQSFAGRIDFNDQIYMPALFGGDYPNFPIVLVDEYQDLSPVNHQMIKLLTKKGRLIGVGDDAQAIYAFRGARAGGMDIAIEHYKMSTHELSVSFRCPSEIVKNVHWRVPNFTGARNGGTVEHLDRLDLEGINPNGVVICRNNAPLMRMAFGLLASGHSVSVAGTDIGPKLIATMRKLGNDSMSQQAVLDAIAEWLANKLDKGSKTAPDFAECMRIFAKHGKTLGTAISYAEHIFKAEGSITLITGHRSKGLEWDHVYHLDSWILKNEGQDRNIRYVIDTRTKDRLSYIDSRSIDWPSSEA